MVKQIFIVATVLLSLAGTPAHSIIIHEAGFSDRLVTTFPFAGGIGDIEFDSNGVAYVSNHSRGQLYSIDQSDSAALVSTVPAGALSQQIRGIALINDEVFFGTIGEVYKADNPDANLLTALTSTTGRPQSTDLELAPAGSEFAGKIVTVGGSFGSLFAIDPVTGAAQDFFSCCDRTQSIEFHESTLYGVGGISGNSLYSISPTNGNALIANLAITLGLPMELDGLAIDPLTGDFYMANGRHHQIIKYTASGVASVFASDVFFGDGAGLAPIAFTPDGTSLWYGEKRGSLPGEYHEISGFAGISPPSGNVSTPATLTLFGLGLASLGWSRRKHNS